MKKIMLSLLVVLMTLSSSFVTTKAESDDPNYKIVYGRDRMLYDIILRNGNNCPRIKAQIPSEGNITKYRLQIDCYDQFGSRIPWNTRRFFDYELYYQMPGILPQGVTIASQGGGIYYLEIDSTAENGTYRLTAVAHDRYRGIIIKKDFDFQLWEEIDHVNVTVSETTLTLPTVGTTKKIHIDFDPVNQDGKHITNVYYRYFSNITGITAVQTGSDAYDLIIDDAASAGRVYIDFLASVSGPYYSSTVFASTRINLQNPVLTSVVTTDATADVPLQMGLLEQAVIRIDGYDQNNQYMTGLSYQLNNLPAGVTVNTSGNGIYVLDVDFSATPGTYKLEAVVKYGSTIIIQPVYLTLNGISAVSMNVPGFY